MLFDLIERLQKKPPHARRRIAFVSALAATLVVFVLWTLAVPARVSLSDESRAAQELAEEVSPFSTLQDGLSQVWQNFQNTIDTAPELDGSAPAFVTEEMPTTTPAVSSSTESSALNTHE